MPFRDFVKFCAVNSTCSEYPPPAIVTKPLTRDFHEKVIALTAVAALLAGCSTIGEVNGVPVGPRANVSTMNTPPFCQANPAICIIGGAVGVGLLYNVINQNSGSGDPEGRL